MKVAEVIIPIPINKVFSYRIPEKFQTKEIVDRRVKVPFGNRNITGYAFALSDNKENNIELKDIIDILDDIPVLNEEIKKLAEWMSDNYVCSIGEALASIVPQSLKAPKRQIKAKKNKDIITTSAFELTRWQHKAFNEISLSVKNNQNNNFLLHGVTGSGKTEIYLQSIQTAIDNNKSAVFLLPEIALTPQFINIVKSRFGNIAEVWHSGISLSQKYKIFNLIYKNEIKIIIGARSSVFLPFKNIGLFIVDEEHEPTYKQDNKPNYNAKDIVLWRAKYHNATVVFGSATPVIESYKSSADGMFKLLELPERIDQKPLPSVKLLSIKDAKKKTGILSNEMTESIKKALARREQVIVFLNRRGFSPSVVCKKCGAVYQCENCSVAMVYHKNPERLKCHYCGQEHKFSVKCNICHESDFSIFGTGTQRIEEELKSIFPHTKIFRLDSDTATSKEVYKTVYEGLKNEEYDILLGTQMIAKGFDFPRVSLVCVVDADTSLFLPDFRSAERTFQLVTQVAGRCGRGNIKGHVLVQTRYMDHYSLLSAKNHNYKMFYEQEIKYRKELNYPPFCNMGKITARNKDDKKTFAFINNVYEFAEKEIADNKYGISLLGPVQSYITKLHGTYRWQIILKGNKIHIKELFEKINNIKLPNGILINLETDPTDLL